MVTCTIVINDNFELRNHHYYNEHCALCLLVVPQGTITTNRTAPFYAGTGLILTCNAMLHTNVDNGVVTFEWSGPTDISGKRYTVRRVIVDEWIVNSLIISPLLVQDDGMYTCTVVYGGNQHSTTTKEITITSKCS